MNLWSCALCSKENSPTQNINAEDEKVWMSVKCLYRTNKSCMDLKTAAKILCMILSYGNLKDLYFWYILFNLLFWSLEKNFSEYI